MATSLRAQAQTQNQTHQAQQSPTSSTSSVTTTPTSPHFHTHQRSQSSLARPLGNGIGNGNGPYGHVYAQPGSRPSTAPTINHPRPVTPALFRPPSNLAFAAYLKSWGNEEIIDFLSIYNCSHHAGAFQKNGIDGKCILDLDTNNLKEMGVVKVGERIKIHNGIKDLRRRAANSGLIGMSRVELRLNGAAKPPLEDVPSSSPGFDGLYTRDNHPGPGMRRLGSSRPPPLDLHSQQSRNNLPLAFQNVPTSIDPSATTPRQINASKDGHPLPPPGPSRNISSTSTASNVTITPAHGQGIVPAPAPAGRQPQINTNHLNLRAPPSRDPGRRSPSPVNTDPTQFIDRPLPPAPNQNQSSAAEYASAIRYGEGRTTPTWGPGGDHQQSHPRQTPNSERRHHPPPIIIRQDLTQHRKGASLGTVSNRSYLGAAPRANTAGSTMHPFAATSTIHEDEPRGSSPELLGGPVPPPMISQSSNGSNGSGRSNRNAGYVVGTAGPGPMHRSASVISSPHGSTGRRDQSGSGSGTLSLEDLRKQLIKFINSEDGTTRTVSLSQCTSGVEILERALKKFGRWGMGTAATTDTESDEDGDQLEIDGWGVYEELEYHENCVPLSEAALLNICMSHRDGTAVREGGLVLRRTRKPQYRKNMEVFLGEAPPTPMSPTSPNYLSTPRPTHGKRGNNDSLTPTKATNKQMKRASTVSVMSGLGVPVAAQAAPEQPPSPTTTARSPSSGSFLTKSKKMYNFFGHRPPSELISNHLAEYFPSAKKRELEKTVRHSMLRMSMGPGSRVGSITSGDRLSLDSPHGSERRQSIEKRQSPEKISSPEKRQSMEKRHSLDKSPQSRRSMSLSTHKSFTASPPADTIPEEENEVEGLPRSNLSIETSSESERPSTGASIESQPPLLPPFEPATESLSESLQAFSPTDGKNQSDSQDIMTRPSPRTKLSDSSTSTITRPRPKSIMLARRGSAGSSRSRMSMLSQLRKNRDKSDTASIITVDQVTADVENRRASRITFADSDGEEELADDIVPAAMEDPIAPTSEADEDEEDEDGEDEASDEEEEEESSEDESSDEDDEIEMVVDEDADHGKAYMSTGSKRIIKWIKGALIGAGSFGSVFLGMDSHSGLLMAVKQVELGKNRSSARTKGMVDALEREIELLKELQHDNIVQYLDSSTDGDFYNIFLEYVPGGSVAALLNKYGAFEEALVKRFVRQILTGLEYLHERDIIHRDIKGANILVDNKGGIKISDFGISKKVESNLLNTAGRAQNRQSLQGSVFWMAPEVVKQTGHSSKADIWSVGCLVVEMLTGSHPWPDLNQLQAMYQIGKYSAPALPNDISPETAQFLDRTFDLDHSARPTAAELLQHPFCTDEPADLEISQAAAQATMAAAAAARHPPAMQSLSALAEAR